MADRYELAFIKNALSVTSTDPQEQTALINLLFQRLLTGNFQISSAGVVTFQFNGLFADGLVGTPSIAFTNEPTTGRYRIGAGNVGESLLGGLVFDWSATRLQMGTIHLTWAFDNTKDIGASGASRPRDLFLGRNAAIGGTLGVTGAVTLTTALTAANGGTGAATLAAHGVVLGNGTSAVNVTGAGTSGQVLTSNGASADPTFQDSALDVLQIEALA